MKQKRIDELLTKAKRQTLTKEEHLELLAAANDKAEKVIAILSTHGQK